MSAGYISSREQAKAHQTRKAKQNARIGDAPAETRTSYRARCKGNIPKLECSVDKDYLSTAPIPAHRALVVIEQPEETPAPSNSSILKSSIVETSIQVGDTVTALPYRTQIGTCCQFIGKVKVVAISTEHRRDLATRKLHPYTRLTVICQEPQSCGFQRRDILADLAIKVVAPPDEPAANLSKMISCTTSAAIQRRLEANRLHQQHLNRPAQMVAPEAQPTRRVVAAARAAVAPDSVIRKSQITESSFVNVLPADPAPRKLFPPATLINGLAAYEQFRNLPRYLDDAQRKGCIEQAEMLAAKIQRYAALNSSTCGKVIWFQVMHYGTVRHWIYDAPTNRVERYWEA